MRQAASFTLLGGACSRRGEQFVRWEPASPQNSPKRFSSSADCRTARTTGAIWHTSRDRIRRVIWRRVPPYRSCAAARLTARDSRRARCPHGSRARARECLRAASYLGFSQSCSFWKCGGNIALTGLTNIAGSRSVIARSLGETSETKNPTRFTYLRQTNPNSRKTFFLTFAAGLWLTTLFYNGFTFFSK